MKVFKPTGYVSLGQYTHGEKGETHYIYSILGLKFWPKDEEIVQQIFLKNIFNLRIQWFKNNSSSKNLELKLI